MNETPVVFPGDRIEIALAQETLIVSLDELVDGVGVAAVFFVVDLDGAGVLFPPVYGFDFLIAAQVFRHSGRCYGEREQNQHQHEENAEQQKPVLPPRSGLWSAGFHG
jgi:hypothetical protein